jgi:hypothetical protein
MILLSRLQYLLCSLIVKHDLLLKCILEMGILCLLIFHNYHVHLILTKPKRTSSHEKCEFACKHP